MFLGWDYVQKNGREHYWMVLDWAYDFYLLYHDHVDSTHQIKVYKGWSWLIWLVWGSVCCKDDR